MTQSQPALSSQLRELVRQRDGAVSIARDLQAALECSTKNPDLPEQTHSTAKICLHCYERLRAKWVAASLVENSIRSLVYNWMRHGRACPFCDQVTKHTDNCYLGLEAGQDLLQEYAAIERERDQLLRERAEADLARIKPQVSGRASFKLRLSPKHR